ncbi:Arv1-domain-containing protein [Lentinus tigrinus ALCF2SS1-7]|uniref:Protein ARV n=1 Tax=Lentinus tigrinus ALCF2SS1-6 TaxID=1328759 RepID=A0A5C2S8B5_9APHY|nr:Arv1-domain-containing protein [Lentinus tigrinus ALCF2SS1-6]RPD74735.1 Arv1-domain-containing protein [Lentinus tigrinus ALCF2SS1-7]
MPICTSCATPTPYLYTVYDSKYNFRLEQCMHCQAFADPYVEHDTLTLLLDLILLKRDVYRHLLYNRGLGARKAGDSSKAKDREDTHSPAPGEHHDPKARWWLILKLGFALICVDAFIRWTYISSNYGCPNDIAQIASWNQAALEGFLRILVGCFFETAAFHAGVVLACYLVLKLLPKPGQSAPVSGIREQFRYSHIPLTLLYSSLTKLFLLFCLSIWRPDGAKYRAPSVAQEVGDDANPTTTSSAASRLHPNATVFTRPLIVAALELLDEDKLDRQWVVRNVLGGMAAGFGLRVVLDCHPIFTTIIILAGWLVKTAVASFVSEWVGTGLGFGGDKAASEMWFAYSIP